MISLARFRRPTSEGRAFLERVPMTPWIFEAGDSLKRFLQGAAAGALVTAIVGLTWGGWTAGNTGGKAAQEPDSATIAAPLPPTNAN